MLTKASLLMTGAVKSNPPLFTRVFFIGFINRCACQTYDCAHYLSLTISQQGNMSLQSHLLPHAQAQAQARAEPRHVLGLVQEKCTAMLNIYPHYLNLNVYQFKFSLEFTTCSTSKIFFFLKQTPTTATT